MPYRISFPTRGVFAESVMGSCDSCETIDDSKNWRWEQSPIDEVPAPTADTASRRADGARLAGLSPTQPPSPIISQQAPTEVPAPAGLAALLNLLSSVSFRDATGLAGSQTNAAAALQQNVEAALDYGREASKLAQQQALLKSKDQYFDAVDKAKEKGAITDAQYNDLYLSRLKGMSTGGAAEVDSGATVDPSIAAAERAIDRIDAPTEVAVDEGPSADGSKSPKRTTVKGGSPTASAAGVRIQTTAALDGAALAALFRVAITRDTDLRVFQFDIEGSTTGVGYSTTLLPLTAGSYTLECEIFPRWSAPVPITIPVPIGGGKFAEVDFTLDRTLVPDPAKGVGPGSTQKSISFQPSPSTRVVRLDAQFTTREKTVPIDIALTAAYKPSAEWKADLTTKLVGAIENDLLGKLGAEIIPAMGFKFGFAGDFGASQKVTLQFTYRYLVPGVSLKVALT